jgi:hypothetical protein
VVHFPVVSVKSFILERVKRFRFLLSCVAGCMP